MRHSFFLFLLLVASTLCQAQVYYVQDMNTTQIAALDRDKTVVLLPGGILEEHGPYLPSFTDGYMNLALTQQIADHLAKKPGAQVLIFPLIPLGNGGANEVARKYTFPGTYTVRQQTLRALLMDVSSELGDQGFKKIFMVHMHGAPNHNQAIDQACAYFNDTYHGRMVNIWNLAFTAQGSALNAEQRKEEGFTVHAGASEHSVLYYLKPEFQKVSYHDAKPVFAAGPTELATVSKKADWPGYWGSPRIANAALGEKVWNGWVAGILPQVDAVLAGTYDFSQPTFYQVISHDPDQNAVNADALKREHAMQAKQSEWLKSKGVE